MENTSPFHENYTNEAIHSDGHDVDLFHDEYGQKGISNTPGGAEQGLHKDAVEQENEILGVHSPSVSSGFMEPNPMIIATDGQGGPLPEIHADLPSPESLFKEDLDKSQGTEGLAIMHESSRSQSSKRRQRRVAIVGFLAIVLTVVVVVCVLRLGSKENQTGNTPTEARTDPVPTQDQVVSPSPETQPDVQVMSPTTQTDAPTVAPFPGSSSGPTPFLDHTMCQEARSLVRGQAFSGSLTGVSAVQHIVDCSRATDFLRPAFLSFGVWYKYDASSTHTVHAMATGKNDTTVVGVAAFTIAKGKEEFCDDIDNAVCISDAHYSGDPIEMISFTAVAGERYYFVVHGVATGNSGDFEISVFDNDDCSFVSSGHAIRPIRNMVKMGSTDRSNPDYLLDTRIVGGMDSSNMCGDSKLDTGSPGVWYMLVGNGYNIGISTCSEETTFDTQLSVFTGTCESLVCHSGNDDASCGLQSSVSWMSVDGLMYYVLVHGAGAIEFGNFTLRITTDYVSVGASCPEALSVKQKDYGKPMPVQLSSTAPTTVSLASTCELDSSTLDFTRTGTWYKIPGSGKSFRADVTTNGGAVLDSLAGRCTFEMTILAGSDGCSSLFCLSRYLYCFDPDNNEAISMSGNEWLTLSGLDFYVVVSYIGVDIQEVENVTLTITEF